MTFTPKAWHNLIAGSTPLNAVALIDLETRLASYTDSLIDTITNWGAKGDARRVTDGAIASGTAALHSAAAAFTTADAGKRVDVIGAGTPGGSNNGVLFATISSVAGGIATLSVPASQTVVSGGTVTYGTDDTAAIQSAHDALSATGGGQLVFPANRNYLMNVVAPKSGVTVMAYGATIYFTSYNQNCGFFESTDPVVGWGIYGANFSYDGVAYGYAGSRIPVAIRSAGSTDIRVVDNTVTDNKDAAFDFRDAARIYVVNNTVRNCCQNAGRNAINIVPNSANPGMETDILISGNLLVDTLTEGIAVVANGTLSTSVYPLRVRIVHNEVRGTQDTGICLEGTSTLGTGQSEILIANNIAEVTGPGATGISVSQGGYKGPWQKILIANNIASGEKAGIYVNAGDVTITGNVITGGTSGGLKSDADGQTVTATLDGTTATLTSVSIPTGSLISDGDFVSGLGIQAGSYLVSGAGTNTWAISQVTTAPGTVTVTARLTNPNVVMSNNVIHMPNVAAPALLASGLRDSTVTDNLCFYDPGNSNNSYGLWANSSHNMSIVNNRVTNAPRWGLRVSGLHDSVVSGNQFRNPSNAQARNDDTMNLASAFNVDIENNKVWDDTGASKIGNAINVVAPASDVRVIRNRLFNWDTPITGTGIIEQTDNRFSTGAPSGRAVLVGGTVTVSTAEVRTGDNIILSRVVTGGTQGTLTVGTIVNNTSFVITSSNGADTSTIYWRIDH